MAQRVAWACVPVSMRMHAFGHAYAGYRHPYLAAMTFTIVDPSSAGDLATCTPAASSAWILSSAPPFPPEMMAPAWPMRRPGGAVIPAMNDTTGLFAMLL